MAGKRPLSSRRNRQLQVERVERRDLLSGLVGIENGFVVSNPDSTDLTVEIRIDDQHVVRTGSRDNVPSSPTDSPASSNGSEREDPQDQNAPATEMKIGPLEAGTFDGMKFTEKAEPATTSMTENVGTKDATSTIPFAQWRILQTPQTNSDPWGPADNGRLLPDNGPLIDPIELPGPKANETFWTPTHRDRDLAFQEDDLLEPNRALDVQLVDPPKRSGQTNNTSATNETTDKKIKSPVVDPFAADTAAWQAKIDFVQGMNQGPKGLFAPGVAAGIIMMGAESPVHRVMSLSNNTLGQLAIALARLNSRDPLVSQLRHLVRLEIRRRFGAEFLPLY